MKRKMAILGSTGSIGTQALDVVKRHPEKLGIEVLCRSEQCRFIDVIPLVYDLAGNFSGGLAWVKKDGKGFYINKSGECVGDCE